jgi:hypothetical protein
MVNWGGGAKGAAGGAAAGAAFGPWGAAIGGVAGGLLGMFSGGGGDSGPEQVDLPYFEQDRKRLGGMLDSSAGPFAGSEWGSLISQLQARASGTGPSVAGNAYKQASQDSMNNLGSLSRDSASPAGARQAILQAGRINQGMAQGYGAMALQEQQSNQAVLAQALAARDNINSSAYQGILGQQLGLSRGQMGADQGNQQVVLQQQQLQNQEDAAQMAALSQLAAGLGKVYGAKPPAQPGASGLGANPGIDGPITRPGQVDPTDPFGKYRRANS